MEQGLCSPAQPHPVLIAFGPTKPPALTALSVNVDRVLGIGLVANEAMLVPLYPKVSRTRQEGDGEVPQAFHWVLNSEQRLVLPRPVESLDGSMQLMLVGRRDGALSQPQAQPGEACELPCPDLDLKLVRTSKDFKGMHVEGLVAQDLTRPLNVSLTRLGRCHGQDAGESEQDKLQGGGGGYCSRHACSEESQRWPSLTCLQQFSSVSLFLVFLLLSPSLSSSSSSSVSSPRSTCQG
mmetsp:Transcript_17677/g.58184  ORF Transcript_17677/g.58184 Transcript_17677/m.58184 type:complete len:237 (-) Transcript_17677:2-712(-)